MLRLDQSRSVLLAGLTRAWGTRSVTYGQTPENLKVNLKKWGSVFHILPPVHIEEGAEGPTALQWLKRRGPPMTEGARQKLARLRKMRLVTTGGKLRQIYKGMLLPAGSRLLIPKEALQPQPQRPGTSHVAAKSARVEQLEVRLAEALQRRVLHMEEDFMVLDKPAGLPTQGGEGIDASLDSLLPRLRFDGPEEPRLVHRLDRNTSGAILVARSADGASWLSRALRRPAEAMLHGGTGAGDSGSGSLSSGPRVQKFYHAIVEDSPSLRERGIVDGQLRAVSAGSGRAVGGGGQDYGRDGQAARTLYRVLQRRAGQAALLELQPVTGRKHQLRAHCADLGAPILGDGLHGRTRSPLQLRLMQQLRSIATEPKDAEQEEGERVEAALARLLRCSTPLQLHCCRVVVERSSGRRVDVTAPTPLHMQRALCALFGPSTATDSVGDVQSMPPRRDQAPDALTSSGSSPGPSTASRHDSAGSSRAPHMPGRSGGTREEVSVHGKQHRRGAAGRSEQLGAEVSAEYGVRRRWSWQRKAGARAAREAVADVKREKKKQKTARKGLRTMQRARAERHTVSRPLRHY